MGPPHRYELACKDNPVEFQERVLLKHVSFALLLLLLSILCCPWLFLQPLQQTMSIVIRARSATHLLRLLPSLQTTTATPSVYARSIESPPCLQPTLPTSHQPFFCPQPYSPFALLARARPFCSSRPESAEKLQPETSIKSVPVDVAHELLQAGHRYLDVRTAEEFSAGHPIGAINIPYMFKNGEEMTKNPKFLEEVSQHFGKGDQIIVGCKSGRRSLLAASDMLAAGYNEVIDVSGGYTDWTEKGLPTN